MRLTEACVTLVVVDADAGVQHLYISQLMFGSLHSPEPDIGDTASTTDVVSYLSVYGKGMCGTYMQLNEEVTFRLNIAVWRYLTAG
jgi:hypothetical protein